MRARQGVPEATPLRRPPPSQQAGSGGSRAPLTVTLLTDTSRVSSSRTAVPSTCTCTVCCSCRQRQPGTAGAEVGRVSQRQRCSRAGDGSPTPAGASARCAASQQPAGTHLHVSAQHAAVKVHIQLNVRVSHPRIPAMPCVRGGGFVSRRRARRAAQARAASAAVGAHIRAPSSRAPEVALRRVLHERRALGLRSHACRPGQGRGGGGRQAAAVLPRRWLRGAAARDQGRCSCRSECAGCDGGPAAASWKGLVQRLAEPAAQSSRHAHGPIDGVLQTAIASAISRRWMRRAAPLTPRGCRPSGRGRAVAPVHRSQPWLRFCWCHDCISMALQHSEKGRARSHTVSSRDLSQLRRHRLPA